MKMHLLCFALLLTAASGTFASEQYLVNFKHLGEKRVLEEGNIIVSQEPHTWSKGLKRSYLRLRCQQTASGKLQKLLSTVDLFDGLTISHRLSGNNIELTVTRSYVKPRLAEIHALSRNECRDMSPVITTESQDYSFTAVDGADESRAFTKNTSFQVKIRSLNER